MIDKKDLNSVHGYPIWRLDAGHLLQKYEYMNAGGRAIHKAVSTVSSRMLSFCVRSALCSVMRNSVWP